MDKTEEFLQKLKDTNRWCDNYDYSKVDFKDNYTKVIVIDKNHGTEHLLRPYDIFDKGVKCSSVNLKNGVLPFEEAREFVRNLGLKNQKEWLEWSKSKRPHNIPSNPKDVYKNDWISVGDWLGNDNVHSSRKYTLSFKELREFVRSLGLKNQTEYIKYCKNNQTNVPLNVERKYKEEWISWSDFLGVMPGWDG